MRLFTASRTNQVSYIFNPYEPGTYRRAISNFVIRALRNENITVYGEGQQTRSFCDVDDLVEGLIRLIETLDEVTGPINLGNPVEFTIRQLAELVSLLLREKKA